MGTGGAQDDVAFVILSEATACVLGAFPSKNLSLAYQGKNVRHGHPNTRSFAIPIRFTVGTGEALNDVAFVILSEAKNLSFPCQGKNISAWSYYRRILRGGRSG